MRTSALVVALVAASATAQPVAREAPLSRQRFEVGLPAEVTLVGLTAGVRPELLFRFGDAGSRSRLRLAAGVLAGPEQLLVPLAAGYRAVYRPGRRVQPLFGVGVEAQLRFVTDAPVVPAFGGYLEGGVGVVVAARVSVSAMLAADVMVLGTPGFGLTPRLLLTVGL